MHTNFNSRTNFVRKNIINSLQCGFLINQQKKTREREQTVTMTRAHSIINRVYYVSIIRSLNKKSIAV